MEDGDQKGEIKVRMAAPAFLAALGASWGPLTGLSQCIANMGSARGYSFARMHTLTGNQAILGRHSHGAKKEPGYWAMIVADTRPLSKVGLARHPLGLASMVWIAANLGCLWRRKWAYWINNAILYALLYVEHDSHEYMGFDRDSLELPRVRQDFEQVKKTRANLD